MFIEPHFSERDHEGSLKVGWIEVICGSMFSGKTEELIRRMKRAALARQPLQIFKPAIDTRYHEEQIVSHNENALQSITVGHASDILALAESAEVVGIDEAQFFEDDLVDVCVQLANQNKRVIVAGLDMDFEGHPFGAMPALMAVAEFVTKVHAICMVCGAVASYSFRLVDTNEQLLLGEKELYEARCRRCFLEGMRYRHHTEEARIRENRR
ncbi:thymidine kinase [Catalinimonas alkaloidigena]|uniref:Thymidine kinase n=1 Tax=Catalinimonas alkaloidigena TaxID=1075417 RepID=A0A1G9EHI9_9BACT|nr:thymidine kinase [Catalinimonas alkaloidigena]SDK75521.1 thymidine kinase [Catalinimonas alkaloidigena]